MIEQKNGEQIFEYQFPGFINENNYFGDKPDDYEVLQVLGEGGFGQVLKVKSKNALGTYAMKKVDMAKILEGKNEEEHWEKYFENEVMILQRLNNPNVCKCYKIFQDNNYLYFIMELMNNGDLKSYYAANKLLNIHIQEEKLWDIFYKCLSGLLYIHKEGLIHRDIKLENLFLDDNLQIKIGDFNVSVAINEASAQKFVQDANKIKNMLSAVTEVGSGGYMAPEIRDPNGYDQKVDIFSMGISFFELMYWCKPYDYDVNKQNFYDQNIYSKEINNFVDKMIEKKPTNRMKSNDAYVIAKRYFIDKFVKNSSINSVMYCLNNFQNFNEYFLNQSYKNFLTDNKRPISKSVYNVIQSLNFFNNKNLIDENMYELRKNLINEGLDVKKDNEEIEPGKFIFFLINKLNSDLNEIINSKLYAYDPEQFWVLSSTYKFSQNNSENTFNLLLNSYNKRLLSLISRNFFNIIKTKKECFVCRNQSFSFSMFDFIPFNVEIISKKLQSNNNLSVKKAFECLLNSSIILTKEKNIFCDRCHCITQHLESKKFYHTAKNLIIVFDRGENLEQKQFINFDEQLILTNNEVERYNKVNYVLLGIICKIENKKENEYVSFVLKQNKWVSNKNKYNLSDINLNLDYIKKIGIVVSLFYYSFDDSMVLYSQSDIESYKNNNNYLYKINPNTNLQINNNQINQFIGQINPQMQNQQNQQNLQNKNMIRSMPNSNIQNNIMYDFSNVNNSNNINNNNFNNMNSSKNINRNIIMNNFYINNNNQNRIGFNNNVIPGIGYQINNGQGSMNIGQPNMGPMNMGRMNMGQPNMGQINMGGMNMGQMNMGQMNNNFFFNK